ncbi:MAG: biotin/lipoyl-binding protein [Anaerolineae bacterium]|nr:biotin/lipoyl-binding protein [Anaerolineae bacterium]
MKHYEITIDGRTFQVEVLGDPTQDQVEVEVDGEVLVVDVRRAVDSAAPIPLPPVAQRSSPQPARPASPPAPAQASPGSATVRAPLPGVVQHVVVKAGQQVQPGEMLLVIEAMKMKNAIRATRGGVIEAVQAVEGRQVAHGDELLRYRS